MIFGSWLIQNFQESKHKSEREEIIEKHRNIEHLFDARRVWLESLYTHQTIKNDSIQRDRIYFLKAYNYIETSLSILSEINGVILKDTTEINSKNNELASILQECNQLYRNGQYGKLSEIINAINAENGYNISAKFQQSGVIERKLLKELSEKSESANKKYLWVYIIGSFFIAIDFILTNQKELRIEDDK